MSGSCPENIAIYYKASSSQHGEFLNYMMKLYLVLNTPSSDIRKHVENEIGRFKKVSTTNNVTRKVNHPSIMLLLVKVNLAMKT